MKIPDQAKEQAWRERLQQLIEGEAETSNPTAAFFLKRLKETVERGKVLQQQLGQARMTIQQMEEEQLRLLGAADAYARDLREWDAQQMKAVPEVPQSPKMSDNGVHEEAPR